MKVEIKIPQLGESITEVEIGKFLKPSGSTVVENEEIVELETEKVNQVLYAPKGGVVSWAVKEGDTAKIGDIIGTVDSEGEEKPFPKKEKPEVESPKKERPEIEPKKEKPEAEPPKREKSERVHSVSAGVGKRIMTEAFVEELREPTHPEMKKELPESRRRMTKIRQTIANRLVDALHSAAMLTTFNEVDMSTIIALRAKYKESFVEKHGVKLGFMSFFVKAVVEALKKFPDLNSYIEGNEIVTRHYYDVGIAVGSERGLVVPVIRGCDRLSFPEIEKEIVIYAKKAREGKLAIADLEGGGFTITNGGIYGSMLSTPIINPPQAGILGMHAIMKRPVVQNDEIVIRPMMYLALSYDHRIVDGKEAVSFLVHIKEVLEDPSRLMFIDTDEKI